MQPKNHPNHLHQSFIFRVKKVTVILFDSTHPIHIYDTPPGLEIPFPSKFPMFSMASYISPPSVGQRGNGCAFRRELAKKLISMAERLGIRALLEQDSGHVCVKIPATGLRCVNGKTSGDKKLQPRDGEHFRVKGFQENPVFFILIFLVSKIQKTYIQIFGEKDNIYLGTGPHPRCNRCHQDSEATFFRLGNLNLNLQKCDDGILGGG